MNNNRARKNPSNHENGHKVVGMQGNRSPTSEIATTSGRQTTRAKKLALLQDVDKLKRKLQDEENIHRALQRAFNRPLGSLPRLPPYLPLNTLELLAEIAVLEEEVVRLEEQVMTCRQSLYQEAVYICSKRKLENPADYYEQILRRVSKEERFDRDKSPVSVVRAASTSSGVVSDQSSLSVEGGGATSAASSEVVSDQTVQSSSNTIKEKQPLELDEPASVMASGEYDEKVRGNHATSSSNQTSDMVSHVTEASSSGLVNSKEVMDEVSSTADSWDNRKGKENQTCSRFNRNLSLVSHPKLASSNLSSSSTNSCKNQKGKGDSLSFISSGNVQLSARSPISSRNVQFSEKKLSRINTTTQKASSKYAPLPKAINPSVKQAEQGSLGGKVEPNKISEDILRCLCTIFIRMSTVDKGTQIDIFPYSSPLVSSQFEKETKIQDPYRIGAALEGRDIGVYKDLYVLDAKTIDLKRKKNALFLLHKLKLLLGKLARVTLDGLTHQQKLAFWINTYNSCLMNAFLERGIPEPHEKVVSLMHEATIAVAGQTVNAITIERFILRLPFREKHDGKKAARSEELKAREMFGLECAEPLVTFALSSGSWSSPAVHIYTGSHVEGELQAAKRDYLQAAIGVSKSNNKLIIPKLLERYQLAKDLQSLVDWVCLQLADEPRKEALTFLERNKGQKPLSELVELVPHDYSFRYLLFP